MSCDRPAPPEVVCLGDLMLDVVAVLSGPLAADSDTPSRVTTTGGGSAANVAAWLATLGTRTAFVGRAGDDVAGRACVEALAATGVDVRVATSLGGRTGTCVVLVDDRGNRSMLPDAGTNEDLVEDDLPEDALQGGGHLHLSGYTLLRPGSRAAALEALARARARGLTTSVDPSSAALLAAFGPARFLRAVRGVDLLLPNAEEAALLSGEATSERGGRALVELAQVREAVVVTRGADGALAVDRDGGLVRTPAVPATVLDTTGAGDAFTAGLLDARWRGSDLVGMLAAGAATAARAVARTGARPGARPGGG